MPPLTPALLHEGYPCHGSPCSDPSSGDAGVIPTLVSICPNTSIGVDGGTKKRPAT